LRLFAKSRGITFPLIADPGSAMIRAYGILNQTVERGSRTDGIPHPGTFILDRRGRVVARFFEDAYQERYTAGTILTAIGKGSAANVVTATTPQLSARVSISDSTAAPGERLSVVADITPSPGVHVYAPGKHTYQVVSIVIAPQPWLRAAATAYPRPEIYHFKPLDERVEVYQKHVTLRRDVTVLATPDAQKLLAGRTSIAISGSLEYQACDDKVCFNPARIPFTFELAMNGLERRPPGQ
jgi:DsbC/DsbD-like thiol-disulfide interchange protein